MPDIKSVLSDEIRRLARKELKVAIQPFQAQLAALRKTVSEQSKLIKELSKGSAVATRKAKSESAPEQTGETAEKNTRQFRLSPERIVKLRQNLGLTQGQFAALLEVNPLSVSNWEQGKAVPRESGKQKIAALRGLGKRGLKAMLAEKGIAVAPSKRKPRTPKQASPESAAPATEATAS